MNNASCDIIRDLLPLYQDGVCSAGSRDLVEAHLAVCPACREELSAMNETLPPAPETDADSAMKAVGRAWNEARKRSFRKGLRIGGGIFLGIAALIFVFFFFFSVDRMIGSSMDPTLRDGDLGVFSRFAAPERDSVVAVPLDSIGFVHFIDIVRVAGVPGDTVDLRDGTLYINGEASDLFPAGVLEPGDRSYPVTLGENEYFVLGDNHANSFDSRFTGYGLADGNSVRGVLIGTLPQLKNPFVGSAAAEAVP